MSKAILVMDMPINCLTCNLRYAHTCVYANKDVLRYYEVSFRPGWCPLREILERKDSETCALIDEYSYGYVDGWNECVEKLGGNE